MISRFFVSFFRAHSRHLLRIIIIIFLSSFAFLLVASITSLVEDTIQNETRAILWADIVLDSSAAPSQEDLETLSLVEAEFDVEIATTLEFQTNILINDIPYLTDTSIISSNYPLLWESLWDDRSWVFVSESIRQILWDWDRIMLWEKEYMLGGDIFQEGFWWFSLFSEGRELWIPQEIAENSELLWLWARISYRFFILVEDRRAQELREFLRSDWVMDNWRVGDIQSRQDIIADVFSELERFIQVFFTGIFVLAFFSLFFTLEALKRITKRDIWLFVLLGYTKNKVFLGLLVLLFWIFILWFASALGLASVSIKLLQGFPLTENVWLTISHLTQSFILTLCIIVFASLYTLRDFYKTPIPDLLKKPDFLAGKGFPRSILLYLLAGILVLLFFLWASPISVVIQSFIILWVITILAWVTKAYFYFLFSITKTLRGKHFLLFHTLRACIRPWNMTLFITLPVIIVGSVFFFLLVFAISFLDITRIDEGEESYFILNINRQESEILKERFENIELYDILLARIVRVNNTPLRDFLESSPRSWEFTREFNLTTNPLPDNRFTRWEELRAGTVSLDEDFASRLGIDIGDEVTFLLAWREVSYSIINTRPALRGDFRPFFYVQLYPDDVSALERSYFWVLTGTELSASELRSQFFNISPRLQLLDVSETISEVTRILWQVYQWVLAIAIYVWVFVWILLSVSLTILSSLRNRESLRLSLLWAPKSFTRNFLALEYLVLLSFSLFLVILVGTILSIWFFQNSSLFDFQLSYILQTTGILLLWGLGLYVSILVMQKNK